MMKSFNQLKKEDKVIFYRRRINFLLIELGFPQEQVGTAFFGNMVFDVISDLYKCPERRVDYLYGELEDKYRNVSEYVGKSLDKIDYSVVSDSLYKAVYGEENINCYDMAISAGCYILKRPKMSRNKTGKTKSLVRQMFGEV